MRTEKLNSYDLKSHRKNFCTRRKYSLLKINSLAIGMQYPTAPNFPGILKLLRRRSYQEKSINNPEEINENMRVQDIILFLSYFYTGHQQILNFTTNLELVSKHLSLSLKIDKICVYFVHRFKVSYWLDYLLRVSPASRKSQGKLQIQSPTFGQISNLVHNQFFVQFVPNFEILTN